jgi:type II restriction/modification system DNA methylase subunit YeeA
MSPREFVGKWSKVTLRERAASQEHFIDICNLIGHPTPATDDPTGSKFTFDKGAHKQKGGEGWADVWKKDLFAWEYKGKHKDLDAAYGQLLQYREALLNPPLLVVSDMKQIIIHTNFTNTVKKEVCLDLQDLLKPEGLKKLQAIFTDPEYYKEARSPEQVTTEAAMEFATLADLLHKYGEKPHEAAHFLIRLLFCLFAEDIGLLPKNLFTELVKNTQHQQYTVFKERLEDLFKAMSVGGWFGTNKIRYFDGKLFDTEVALGLDSDGMDILAKVCDLDWSNIEPSILGTLFERSLDPSKRSQVGAHYTSKEDILLVIEPVLMSPLRLRWKEVQIEALKLASNHDNVANSKDKAKFEKELYGILQEFIDQISTIRVLDPACGSGNFLYVALQQLLDLEKEVGTFASTLGLKRPFPCVSPAQLHGIELSVYAHELAQITIWIGYIQWLIENGFGLPAEPILKPLDSVLLMDAILDVRGQPKEPEWPEVDVIIGNPPFLGSRKIRPTFGNSYCDALLKVYGTHIRGTPDLVCFWFEKTLHLIHEHKVKRAGLLATQAIRGGTNRQVLDHIKDKGNIFMAWSDREWMLEGAKVHVSIVGFDNGAEQSIYLNGNPVKTINSDLTSTVDLSIARQLEENKNLSFQGDILWGDFTLNEKLAKKFLSDSGNPNSKPNSNVIRLRCTGDSIVSRAPESYVIDFGLNMSQEEASQYTVPFEYLKAKVYPNRQETKWQTARDKWWIHWKPRDKMRAALKGLDRYIATPRVGKHRVFVWLDKSVLPDAELIVFARQDDYFFGVLQSKIHEVWSRRKSTQLRDAESACRYTSKTAFQTFPFPWPPGQESKHKNHVKAITEAAQALLEKRNAWLNPQKISESELKNRTLTKLYNQRPTWLNIAHGKLDEAVLNAYGWTKDISDEEILEKLLSLNLKRVDI